MWRQRDPRWRPPLAGSPRRVEVPDTVWLLDSISLTAHFTDPNPRGAAEVTSATHVLEAHAVTRSLDRAPVSDLVVDWYRPTLEWGRLSLRKAAIGFGSLALLIGSLAAGLTMTTAASPPTRAHVGEAAAADRLLGHHSVNLAPATSTPAPAVPLIALAQPTSSHEVFGYEPYWSLPQESQLPVHDFSTIAYFSVDVNADGTIDTSGPGWDGYESQDLTDLVNSAHQAGDRVVLTATDFSQSSLDAITHDSGAGVTLGEQLTHLVRAKNLDGVNLDFEGTGSGDQAGLDHLVSQVDYILHAVDPHYQLTMATYASSAGDSGGFYDVKGLSQWVNAFFVMAYDVNQGPAQGNGNAGGTDADYISQYAAAAGASKVILGLPLFGYDVPSSGPGLGAAPTGGSTAVTYAEAMASGPTYWDAATQTAWTSYETGGQWHQVFFDNVNTLADKVQLAGASDLLGIGAWALGMEGNDDSILSVLDGGSAPLRTPPVGPVGTSAGIQVVPTFQQPGNAGAVSSTPIKKHKGRGASTTTTTTTVAAKATTTTTVRPPKTTTTTTTSTTTTTTTVPKQSTTTTTTSSTTGGTSPIGTSTTSTTGSP